MGCTSSAPSMAPANATERNISFADEEEKPTEELKKMETQTQAIIENKVLPNMCDNLGESILLSQTGKSILDTSQRIDKDVQTDSFRIDNENAWDESFRIMQEEKEHNTPKLEEVVEQVVEMLHSDNTHRESARNTPEEPEAAPEVAEVSEEVNAADTAEELNKNCEHLEEMVSPSLSESSRATRWEALADIAAELPPSLAVDPLTGQIYTLK